MFFIRTAKFIAHLIFWLSLLRIGMGFLVAFGSDDMAQNFADSARYLGTANSGEAINEGTRYLLVAIALGVIAEIGGLVARQTDYYESEEDDVESH
ncbi:hypothetical protein Q4555_05795 [Octadecabacter sp. 1_MG-2023]|uniref:hypothetical protein n=1 Tax=unclassified Octadecabacter TaxID=196158 RepID=UPI001C090454|nr:MULTISPECIES: hypothetical protein [unclassified Octadecabacter]MBU2994536.1 hypothetical protein [Octadecabacter sp. B2R22]MDO6734171.1 hypothetical protein [Octadecabacter sp. 1_MG-2023]